LAQAELGVIFPCQPSPSFSAMCVPDNSESQSSKTFCGSVKSLNTRRGFGFVSCEETAQRFGRDVYLSKDEVMALATDPFVATTKADAAATANSVQPKPPVQEGDALLFKVKLSVEGFPQVVQAQKMRRLRGVVLSPPSADRDGTIIVSTAASGELLGSEVRLKQASCGQLQLLADDKIDFCCTGGVQALEAQLIELVHTSRKPCSVLGWFSLEMPCFRDEAEAMAEERVHLGGQALLDRILLSEVPSNLGEHDLMRLFGTMGGQEAIVTPANANGSMGFASVAFDGPGSVAKFLVSTSHTVTDNGSTQLAYVGSFGDLQVETDSSIGLSNTTRYASGGKLDCQGLPAVTNFAVSTTPETWQPILQVNPEVMQTCASSTFSSYQLFAAGMCMAQTCMVPSPNEAPQLPNSVDLRCLPMQGQSLPMVSVKMSVPSWRCAHGSIVVPPEAPEMAAACDNACCSLCMQWPTVVHASTYVVEVSDQDTMTTHRFSRALPESAVTMLMDLGIDAVRPGTYASRVRCVAPCGCESAPSQWSVLQVSGMRSVMPLAAPLQLLPTSPACLYPSAGPLLCPPLPSSPPSLPASFPMMAVQTTVLPAIREEASIALAPTTMLPVIPEEALAVMTSCEEPLTLD